MGKASSTKKVARAARTGGGRTARGTGGSLVWPALIGVVVVVGVILIGISRSEISGASTPPRIGKDHWHAAIGFYDCDHFLPNEAQFENSEGLHTHGDGLIHLHPFSAAVAGKNATLGKYVELAGIKYSSTAAVFGNTTLRDGAKCGSKKGALQTLLNGKVVADPNSLPLKQGQVIVVALAPKGATIPPPPSAATLQTPSDLQPSSSSTVPLQSPTSAPSSSPPSSPPSSSPPSSSAPTSAPPSSAPPSSPTSSKG